MPFGTPPSGGPLSRSRTRLSASSLTKFLRCKKQFFLGNKLGLSAPKSISQILGIVIEESFCSILMRRPASIYSLEELTTWCHNLAIDEAIECHRRGKEIWDTTIWRKSEQSWESVDVEVLEQKLKNALALFLVEVENCHNANGGPYVNDYRNGNQPFDKSSPAWGDEPLFPIPDKVRNFGMRTWSENEPMTWQKVGSPLDWSEAWEIARPWIKDPRVHQPQRLFHPAGWAAGELDLVLRWDGRIRLVDIKSGNPTSKFAESLVHQLKFYSWLWRETHDNQPVDGIEGWYLGGPERVQFEVPKGKEMDDLGIQYQKIHREMQQLGEGPVMLPDNYPNPCQNSAGCYWCGFGDDSTPDNTELFDRLRSTNIKISPPSQKIGEIQSRVNIKGKFTGQWGPLPNHYAESVLGAMVSVSGTQITVEESEPNAFPSLHNYLDGEVVILNALPGVWRGNPRLYLDSKSEIIPVVTEGDKSPNDIEFTRVGLMRTRANIEGLIISIDKRTGVRLDEKPWSMLSMHVWDGNHVVEVVAFGSSITSQMLEIRPGDPVKIISAELGWRSGLPQLRIDQRTTRITMSK